MFGPTWCYQRNGCQWPVVNLSGVAVRMVGWKQAPLSTVTSRFPLSHKYFHTWCIEMEMRIEYIYMSMIELCIE
jgi:hypothetical protein